MMHSIEFTDASMLPYVLLALICALFASLLWMRRRSVIVMFYGRRGNRLYGTFRILGFVSVLLAAGLCVGLLLARPYLRRTESYPVYEPLHIAIVSDLSMSMLAQATQDRCGPSRLDVIKSQAEDFVAVLGQRRANGLAADKLALVPFSRFGYRAIPIPTDDYALFRRVLEQELEPGNVKSLLGGTNHWHAVERALEVFVAPHESAAKRVIIILTDGEPDGPEDILAENREKVLRSLSEAGEISIHIVGVGDPDAEYFIPLKRLPDGCPDRDAGYLVQREGPGKDQLINTRADTVALQELARELGGTYAHSQTGSEVSKMVADILAMERVVIATQHRVEYTDLTEYLVMAALVLLGALLILKTP